MSVDGDTTTPSARVSMDTTVNINEDVASEYSHESARKPVAGSVTSNFQGSAGDDSIISAFNILKFGYAEDEKPQDGVSPLGPNSIFELTSASDVARIRSNRPLKAYLSVNGGANTIYNLTKPTSKDIPQIQLQSLKHKVSSKRLSQELVRDMAADYESFEHTNRNLTEDMLSRLSGSSAAQVSNDLTDEDKLEIPEIFEKSDFHLDDPRIFRQVMENTQILPDPDSHESTHIVQNTEVQEKLSQYLDRVEVELIHEISRTSDSFFSTLGEIQGIKSQSANSIDQFRVIKNKLDSIEQNQARCGLKILDLLDERKNVCHLESSVLQLKETVNWFNRAEDLYSQGHHSECLDSILIIEHLINGTSHEDYPDPDTFQQYPKFEYPPVSLASVPALSPIKNKLYMLKQACSRGYIDSFVNLLLEDLRSHIKSVPPTDTMDRICKFVNPQKKYSTESNMSYYNVPSTVKEQLTIFIKNLYKSNHLIEAFSEYQTKIITEVKGIIRANLPSASGKLEALQLEASSNPDSRDSSIPPEGSQNDTLASASNSLSSNLKNLSPKDYTDMMKTTFANLSESFRRLTTHQKLLLDLSLTVVAPNDTLDVMSLDITSAINRAIEITQVRLVKISNVRSEQLCDLSVPDYLNLFALSSGYLSECEFINPGYNASSPGSSFNDWVKNHVGYYVHRFHSSSLKRFVNSCDKETWKECTDLGVIASSQILLNEVVEFSRFRETDGKEGIDGKAWRDLLVFHSDESVKATSTSRAEEQTEARLRIDKTGYMVPQLMLGVVETVRDFVIISSIFASRASTIKSNILTYFKVMNSRISQAILNAGATRTAGLRHITTKHLALCIQTIEFLHALLSSVQHIYSSVADNVENQQGIEPLTFGRVISNYKDHENELFSKLVSIMKDRTINHCSEIVKIDWSEPLRQGQQCHHFMEILVKETSTVAKVLSKYLKETDLSFILSQIFDNYKKLLLNCFCTELPQFKDFNEKHSLLRDIDYFRVKLGEIPGYGNSGQVIWENVNALPTIEDSKMEEIMRNNIEGERAKAARLSEELNGTSEAKTTKEVTPSTEVEASSEPNEDKKQENSDNAKEVDGQQGPQVNAKPEFTTEETEATNGKVDENSESDKAEVEESKQPQEETTDVAEMDSKDGAIEDETRAKENEEQEEKDESKAEEDPLETVDEISKEGEKRESQDDVAKDIEGATASESADLQIEEDDVTKDDAEAKPTSSTEEVKEESPKETVEDQDESSSEPQEDDKAGHANDSTPDAVATSTSESESQATEANNESKVESEEKSEETATTEEPDKLDTKVPQPESTKESSKKDEAEASPTNDSVEVLFDASLEEEEPETS